MHLPARPVSVTVHACTAAGASVKPAPPMRSMPCMRLGVLSTREPEIIDTPAATGRTRAGSWALERPERRGTMWEDLLRRQKYRRHLELQRRIEPEACFSGS